MADLSPSANYGGILGMSDALMPTSSGVDVFGQIAGIFSGDWLGTGLSVLGGVLGGGSTDISQSAAAGQSALNTSGWAIGEGTAEGADLTQSITMQNMNEWPWYVWAAGTLVCIAIIKKAV